jgi:hypothetical protein
VLELETTEFVTTLNTLWSLDRGTYLNDTLDVSMTLGKIDRPQFGCSLAVLVVALEDTAGTFTLASDNSSHFVNMSEWI